MNHIGDITRVNGAEVAPVWCITGGSPCQDLSIAGKRAGLAGARSGLYMEQIRVVKEMREHDRSIGRTDELVRPRYMVWENVPGAFSSNFKDGFGDFGAVLEEAVRITEPGFSLPRLPNKQKWTKAGGMLGDGWSVAWRTHDAQYWGVPQRRRRISMVVDFNGFTAGDILFERFGGAEDSGSHEFVADFGGNTAHEILFEPRSVSGNPTESGAQGKRPAGAVEGGTYPAVARYDGSPCVDRDPNIICANPWDAQNEGGGDTRKNDGAGNGLGVGKDGDPAPPLTSADKHIVAAFKSGQGAKAGGIGYQEEVSPTLSAVSNGSNQVPAIFDMSHANDVIRECGEVAPSLQARMATDGNQVPLTYQQVTGTLSAGAHAGSYNGQDAYNDMLVAHTLRASGRDSFRADSTTYVLSAAVDCRNFTENGNVNGTLQAKESGGSSLNLNNVCRQSDTVRRLTPLECTRLQGFPDGWVDIGEWTDEKGRVHKEADAPKYKALGNSIALPFWRWMFGRMAAYLPDGATLGSLFDGIGGFPLCWESIHGKGTAVWASEIDPFAIAVTKNHFGGDIR